MLNVDGCGGEQELEHMPRAPCPSYFSKGVLAMNGMYEEGLRYYYEPSTPRLGWTRHYSSEEIVEGPDLCTSRLGTRMPCVVSHWRSRCRVSQVPQDRGRDEASGHGHDL
jgi:hypothetical protein